MPGPISRLDRDTSGIILFALSPSSKSFFGKTMEEKKFVKKYWVLVSGKTEEKGKIDIPLFHNRVTRKMEASSHEEGKKSITLFKRKEYFQRANMSFVEVELITGRMHQIRAHFSLLGFPVVGDILYGNQEINTFCEKHFSLKQNFLHAHSLSWEDSGKIFSFESPLPKALEEMKRRIENEE
jgi:23S rRNA pseudouridine955/2504/2580 synthase